MPREYPRRYRVADQIQRELGELMRGIKDPRVQGMVTVSGIDVSPDLRHAKVFVTVLETADPEATVTALNRAAGYLRGRLGERLTMRGIPRLVFHYDASLDQADRVERLLRDALDKER